MIKGKAIMFVFFCGVSYSKITLFVHHSCAGSHVTSPIAPILGLNQENAGIWMAEGSLSSVEVFLFPKHRWGLLYIISSKVIVSPGMHHKVSFYYWKCFFQILSIDVEKLKKMKITFSFDYLLLQIVSLQMKKFKKLILSLIGLNIGYLQALFSLQACVCLNLRKRVNMFFLSNVWLPSIAWKIAYMPWLYNHWVILWFSCYEI